MFRPGPHIDDECPLPHVVTGKSVGRPNFHQGELTQARIDELFDTVLFCNEAAKLEPDIVARDRLRDTNR